MIERKCINCKHSRVYCDDNDHNQIICVIDEFEAVNVEDYHKCSLHEFMQMMEADNE